MFEVLRKIFRTGTVTRRHLRAEAPMRYRGMVTVHEEECNGCGSCVSCCPAGALSLTTRGEDSRILLAYDKCIYCHECVANCSHGALQATNKNHPAVKKRECLLSDDRTGENDNG